MFDITGWIPGWVWFIVAIVGVALIGFWHRTEQRFGQGSGQGIASPDWRERAAAFAEIQQVRAAAFAEIQQVRATNAANRARLAPILCVHCHHERNQRLGLHEAFPANAIELTCHHHRVLLLEEQTRTLDYHNAERATRATWQPPRLEPVTAAPSPSRDIPLGFWASDGASGESVRNWTVQRLASGGWTPQPDHEDDDD